MTNTNKIEIEEMNDTIDEIKEQIEETEDEINDYENHNDNKITEYKDMLDETYALVEIGDSIFNPSEILQTCDETGFRCGFNDWADGLITELNNELTDLKTKLEEAETELKELQGS